MPTLERVVPFFFTAADSRSGPEHIGPFRDHMASLYGDFPDLSWLEHGTLVSFHDMVRVVAEKLAAELAGVDLVITVDARPDCRMQSMAGCVLADLVPGNPFMLGISEQGIAGPFLALRIALDRMARGESTRALILIMEQSTLPPDRTPVRSGRDVAVALLLGPDGPLVLGRPEIAVSRGIAAQPATSEYPCAGPWLGLSENGGEVVVAERDPVLPYACAVTLLPKEPSG